MKITAAPLLSIVCFLGTVDHLEGYRILGVIPTPSYSHQIPYRRLWLELVKRGHEVVLITTNPIPTNVTNLTQIDVSGSYANLRQINFMQRYFAGETWMTFITKELRPLSLILANTVLNNTELKKMYAPDSNVHFDLVIMEMLFTPALYVLAHRFNAPLIGVTSLGVVSYNEFALGGVVQPSQEYSWELESKAGTNLPFWKRLRNFVQMWNCVYVFYRDIIPAHQALAEQYFGKNTPPVMDILKNSSLLFVNQAEALTPARPKFANMISFTSLHVKSNPDPLPADLKRFLNDAPAGFIYFCLGSNTMSSDLPPEVLQIFIDVFAKLPYKVVWKFEKELPGKPKNVYTAKWLPQHSILAHPKIKLFIYQGGLQSTEEALHFEVPLIGMPIMMDQFYQVGRMATLGAAVKLDVATMTRDELGGAIQEVITNKSYKQKMSELKVIVNDNPYDLGEHLAWWAEYVIRHKGALHFRSNLAKQPWYQRCDMDIVVFLSIVAFIVLSNLASLIAKIIVRVYKLSHTCPVAQKQKLS